MKREISDWWRWPGQEVVFVLLYLAYIAVAIVAGVYLLDASYGLNRPIPTEFVTAYRVAATCGIALTGVLLGSLLLSAADRGGRLFPSPRFLGSILPADADSLLFVEGLIVGVLSPILFTYLLTGYGYALLPGVTNVYWVYAGAFATGMLMYALICVARACRLRVLSVCCYTV